eukprot:Rmarinus@m.12024
MMLAERTRKEIECKCFRKLLTSQSFLSRNETFCGMNLMLNVENVVKHVSTSTAKACTQLQQRVLLEVQGPMDSHSPKVSLPLVYSLLMSASLEQQCFELYLLLKQLS